MFWLARHSILLLGVSLLLEACGKDESIPQHSPGRSGVVGIDSEYRGSYQYELSDCSTGRHYYRSWDQLCQMLRDEGLNRFCAPRLRKLAQEQYCTPAVPSQLEPKWNGDSSGRSARSSRFVVFGRLDRDSGVERFEASIRIASLAGAPGVETPDRSAPTLGEGRDRGLHSGALVWLDLNPGRLEILGQPPHCEWSLQFSPLRARSLVARMVLSPVGAERSRVAICREFLGQIQMGFTAIVRGAEWLPAGASEEKADVYLYLYSGSRLAAKSPSTL